MSYETVEYAVDAHVATLTLNRPGRLNAFTQQMCDEVQEVWDRVRLDDEVRAVVLRAAGDRAFCTGMDRDAGVDLPENVWSRLDPGLQLGPKANHVWKPVVCAVNGMCAGGAFYFLNEADIIICDESATFFDPHVTYGMVSALEPLGLLRRIPMGEVLRWALVGLDERMSAARAREIGLVSEVIPDDRLHARAQLLAERIAQKPPAAIQGTVRAIWEGAELSPRQAQMVGLGYTTIGNTSMLDMDEVPRPRWELR